MMRDRDNDVAAQRRLAIFAGLREGEDQSPNGTVDRRESPRNTSATQAPGRDRQQPTQRGRPSQATRLVNLALPMVQLFHDGDVAYATVFGSSKTFSLSSRTWRRQLSHLYYREYEAVPSNDAIKNAINTLSGKALYDGPDLRVDVRVAQDGDALYLDLGREDWKAVRITPRGWSTVDIYGVRFRHPQGMRALPIPQRGGSLQALRDLVNVEDDKDWRLLVAWLLSAFLARGPYPVLILAGEAGAAKSTTGKLLKSIVDPSKMMLRTEPRDPRDLAIAAANSWVIAFDNLSHMPAWLSDFLCILSTGGTFATRALYEDAEEAIFDAQRPVILTSIEDIADRGDLLDRAVSVCLPAIPEDRRRTETSYWAAANALIPAILGALLDIVVDGLRRVPSVHLHRAPRMADFAAWVTACEGALGWPAGSFLATYRANIGDANEVALESSPIYPYLRELVESQPTKQWQGSATELLNELNRRAGDKANDRTWPKRANGLSGKLRRLAPNLRRAGITIDFPPRESSRTRAKSIRLESRQTSSASSEMSETMAGASRSGRSEEKSDDPESLLDGPVCAENHVDRTISDDADDVFTAFAANQEDSANEPGADGKYGEAWEPPEDRLQ